jgi:hypothetical protein
MKMFRLGIVAIFAASIASASATDLNVVNPSFELDVPNYVFGPEGVSWGGPFTGWTADSNAGFWAPVLSPTTFGSLPDGIQAGFTGSGNPSASSMFQDLSETIAVGKTYTLSAYLGNRAGFHYGALTTIGTIALADSLGNVLASSGPITPAAGQFELNTLSYTVPNGSASAGLALRILFSSPANGQMSYDLVSVQAVPEPGSFAALAVGLLVLGRKRSKSR